MGRLCARRDRFGAQWTTELVDEADDGREVTATISLDVTEAPDLVEAIENDAGPGESGDWAAEFSPKTGTAIGEISIQTCVVIRFRPNRCRSASAALPPLDRQGTAAHLTRLRSLVFEEPLDSFIETRQQGARSGVDDDFDWASNGCSAGRLAGFFDDRLEEACLRHDFAYRNFGNLFYDATDAVRRNVDEQLAADAVALGQGTLAPGLLSGLQQFGGPAFYGTELADLWALPGLQVVLQE